jgi:hypothetical protein
MTERLDSWITLPSAPAAASAAGAPVSYSAVWKAIHRGEVLSIREGRGFSIYRPDLLRWAGQRQAKGATR